MKKLFAILSLATLISGCASPGFTTVNPYRPMSAASEVHSAAAKELVKWAKEVPGGQSYESRSLNYVNGYPSVQWIAGSHCGKPPPYGFGNTFGGWDLPHVSPILGGKMKVLMFGVAFALLQLTGCGVMVVETRGFTPRVTNAIMGTATAAAEKACREGVAHQSRQAEVRNVYYGGGTYKELPISRSEAAARSVTVCQ